MLTSWDQLVPYALFIGLVAVLLKVLSSVRSKSKHGALPPCLPSLPLVGSLPFIGKIENAGKYFLQESKTRGKVFAFHAGSRYTVVLNGREIIHEAFIKNGLTFADREHFSFEKTIIGNPHLKGMAVHPYNDKFAKMRRTSMTLLKDLGYGRKYVESRIGMELEDLVEKLRKLDGRPRIVNDLLYQCNNGIMMSFMFGRQFDYDNDPLMQHVGRFITLGLVGLDPQLNLFPVLSYLPKYRRALDKVAATQKHLFTLFEEYTEQCVRNDEDSFVNSYVKSFGPEYDKEQLNFLLRDLLAAGSETTMTTILWALVYLANHQEWQTRLQAQIDDVLGHPTSSRKPTLEDSRRLPYVEATILEVMRIETVVPQSVPRKTLGDATVNGFFVPKGTMVIPNLYGVHMDPEVWPEPTIFRPERFLDSNECIVNKERVIPFSIGKRSCFGEILARQELFLIITRLTHLFDIRPPAEQSRIDFVRRCGVTIHPLPFEIRFIPRAASNKATSEALHLLMSEARDTVDI